MDKNRDDKLELDKNMNDFSSDDDIESLLISSSSATDALSALSFDKKSHTLRGNEHQSEDDADKSADTTNEEERAEDIEPRKAETEASSEKASDEIVDDLPFDTDMPDSGSDKSESDELSDDLNITLGETINKGTPVLDESKSESSKTDVKVTAENDDENKADNPPEIEIKDDIPPSEDENDEAITNGINSNGNASDSASEENLDKALPSTAAVDSRRSEQSHKPKRKPPVKKGAKAVNGKRKGGAKRKKTKVNNSIFTGIIITIIILTVSTVIAFTGITVGLEFLGIGKSSNTIKLNIDESYGVDEITDALYDKGIIDNKFLFKLCIDIKGAADKIVPGDIELQPSMGYNEKINALMQSRQNFETVEVTFPEGTTLIEAAKLLKEKEVISSVTNFIYDFNSLKVGGYEYEDVIDAKGNKFFAMEGYFFPDTYEFYKESDNETVIRRIRDVFNTRVTDEMRKRAEALDYSLDEVMTLASIVQLESASVDEMPTIASILKNRLEDGPYNRFGEYIAKLQSDPTSNYYTKTIVPTVEEINNYTTSEAREFKAMYDTYEREGLPVGPICNPGLDAINAVLYPAETDYFYFCHDIRTKKGYYAETLADHEANLVKAGIN